MGREGAAIGESLHTGPRESKFDGPAAIDVGAVVDFAIDLNGGAPAWEIPVEKGPAEAARMSAAPERFRLTVVIAAEGNGLTGTDVELGRAEAISLLEGVLPDEEDFVDSAQGIDFELVVAIAAVDEELDIVFIEDERVAFGEGGLDERLFDPEGDIEVLIVPECSGARVEESWIGGDHIAEARGAGGAEPKFFGQVAVHDEWRGGSEATVFGGGHIREGSIRERLLTRAVLKGGADGASTRSGMSGEGLGEGIEGQAEHVVEIVKDAVDCSGAVGNGEFAGADVIDKFRAG